MIDRSYSVDEVEVHLSVSDGKFTAESRSGAKAGSVGLNVEEGQAEITLNGAGADFGNVTLTGPELSNFRTLVDAALSSLSVDRSTLEHDGRVLYSGYESLVRVEDGFGFTVDSEALQTLGLIDEGGTLAGGGRQVRCTVLNSGTAILNLREEDESGFEF